MKELFREPPKDYVYVPVPENGLLIPVPNGWFFNKSIVEGTNDPTYLATRESVRKNNGVYATGMQVIVLKDVARRTNFSSAEELARSYLSKTNNMLRSPISEVELSEDSPLIRATRRYLGRHIRGYLNRQLSENITETIRMHPFQIYIMIAANRDTDAAYIVDFTTPAALWEEDKDIADSMVENLVISPTGSLTDP